MQLIHDLLDHLLDQAAADYTGQSGLKSYFPLCDSELANHKRRDALAMVDNIRRMIQSLICDSTHQQGDFIQKVKESSLAIICEEELSVQRICFASNASLGVYQRFSENVRYIMTEFCERSVSYYFKPEELMREKEECDLRLLFLTSLCRYELQTVVNAKRYNSGVSPKADSKIAAMRLIARDLNEALRETTEQADIVYVVQTHFLRAKKEAREIQREPTMSSFLIQTGRKLCGIPCHLDADLVEFGKIVTGKIEELRVRKQLCPR